MCVGLEEVNAALLELARTGRVGQRAWVGLQELVKQKAPLLCAQEDGDDDDRWVATAAAAWAEGARAVAATVWG